MMRTTDNSKELFSEIKEETDDIADLREIGNKNISILAKNNPNLLIFPQNWQLGVDKDDKIFEINDNELITGNIMGFIGYKKTKLTISSRFHSNNKDYFLHYMLCKVLGINVVNLDFSTGEENIHDFLPYLFPSYLQNALSQGLYKQYKRKQYNDANIKGSIDINRHIKVNIPFMGKIAYTTREHSHDNDITQLIRHTIEHLRTHAFGHSILTNGADIRANISQIEYATPTYKKSDLQKIIRANIKNVNHPYFTKYRDLQKLCLQILRREKNTFGEKNKVHGLLFDGAWLWEEYTNTIISKDFWHPNNKKHLYKQRLFLQSDENKEEGSIYPDFISRDTQNRIIADAKYKPIENIKDKDYLQLLAYMFRFDSKIGCYIYPSNKKSTEPTYLKLLKGAKLPKEKEPEIREENVIIKKLGMKIPQSNEKFEDFCKYIGESEDALREKISK